MSNLLPGALNLGVRVFVRRLGKADCRGEITWAGPSKWGDGYRYKVRADDGSTHWVDGKDITVEGGSSGGDPDAIGEGAQVRVTGGPHAGVEGEVYIASLGSRFGIRDDNEETYWVDGEHLERV